MGEGGGSPPILDPLAGRPAGWCRPCLALCLHATEPHIAHDMLMEQFFLNNTCWKLFVSLTVTCNAPTAIVLDNGAYPAREGGGGGLGPCRATVPPHRVCRVTWGRRRCVVLCCVVGTCVTCVTCAGRATMTWRGGGASESVPARAVTWVSSNGDHGIM